MLKPRQLDLFATALLTGSLALEQAVSPIINPKVPPPRSLIEARNFRLVGDRALATSWSSRALHNIAAIELMQEIERSGRPATPEEQAKLILFTGFGATKLAQGLFPVGKVQFPEGWAPLGDRLKRIVSTDDWRALAASTPFAHYTPEYMVREMWRGVQNLGFTGGSIIEPGMGTGLFFALAPDPIAANSRFVGIEKDPITARIASLIHPLADVRCVDFTASSLVLNGPFDLAIGNPPFSDLTVKTPVGPLSLHEYFIWRALQDMRPDAVAAFVVSRYLMDRGGSTSREAINRVASLIGAIRMPQGSMRFSSGTDVVADILFLRRRGDLPDAGEPWIDVVGVPAEFGAKGVAVNRYFADHPELVLGRHGVASGQFGMGYTCQAYPDGPKTPERLAAAIDAITAPKPTQNPVSGTGIEPPEEKIAEIRKEISEGTEQEKTGNDLFQTVDVRPVAEGGTVREGSFVVDDQDRLCRISGSKAVPVKLRGEGADRSGLPSTTATVIRGLIPIRDAVRDVLRAQATDNRESHPAGTQPWDAPLARLRTAYQRFYDRHGPINLTITGTRTCTRTIKHVDEETGDETVTKEQYEKATYTLKNLAPFAGDPDAWLVASIERYDIETDKATPGPIFTQRLIKPRPSRSSRARSMPWPSRSIARAGSIWLTSAC